MRARIPLAADVVRASISAGPVGNSRAEGELLVFWNSRCRKSRNDTYWLCATCLSETLSTVLRQLWNARCEDSSTFEWCVRCLRAGVPAVAFPTFSKSAPMIATGISSPTPGPAKTTSADAVPAVGGDFLSFLLLGLAIQPGRNIVEGDDPPEEEHCGSRLPERKKNISPAHDEQAGPGGPAVVSAALIGVTPFVPVPSAVPDVSLNPSSGQTSPISAEARTGEGGSHCSPSGPGWVATSHAQPVGSDWTLAPEGSEGGRTSRARAPDIQPFSVPLQSVPAFEARIRTHPVEAEVVPEWQASPKTDSPTKPETVPEPDSWAVSSPGRQTPTSPCDQEVATPLKPVSGRGSIPVLGTQSTIDNTRTLYADQGEQRSSERRPAQGDDPHHVETGPVSPVTHLLPGVAAQDSLTNASSDKEPDSVEPQLREAGAPNTATAPRPALTTRDISLQMQSPGSPRVDVQVSDRASGLHVVVRTLDAGLTRDLRTNLPELTQRLNQQGVDVEAWSPVEMHNLASGHEHSGQAQGQSPTDDPWSGGGGRSSGGRGDGHSRHHHSGREQHSQQSFTGHMEGADQWQPVQ